MTKKLFLLVCMLKVPVNNFSIVSRKFPVSLDQYLAADKVTCSRIEHSDSTGDESQTSTRSIRNLMLYQLSHCGLPKAILKDSLNL